MDYFACAQFCDPILVEYCLCVLLCRLTSSQHFSTFAYLHSQPTLHTRMEETTIQKSSSLSCTHLMSASCTMIYACFLSALAPYYESNSRDCSNPSIRTGLLEISLWPNHLHYMQSENPHTLLCCLQSPAGRWRTHYHLRGTPCFPQYSDFLPC